MKKILITLLSLFTLFGCKKTAEENFDLGWKALITQDYQKAKEYFELSANQGSIYAKYNLGVLFDEGKGITQDYQKAKEYYELAANQGYAPAQYNLGVMYQKE